MRKTMSDLIFPKTVKLRRKSDGAEVEAMLHDGTQQRAVDISVWAGAKGFTINIGYRGGEPNDWFLSFFPSTQRHEKARIGDWVLWDGAVFYFCPGDRINDLYGRMNDE